MGILDVDIVKAFIRTCSDGWDQGWHERNGGNLSYRLTKEEVNECREYFCPREWQSLKIIAEKMAGEYFLVTGSGRFMRNVPLNPEENICIVEINEKGDMYRIVWGLAAGGNPTSELPTHIMNHNAKALANKDCRVIYHAHTPNLIALTFVLPLTDKDFTRALWTSATECPVVFPEGVGVVEWKVPGGAEIAYATSRLMYKYDAVVWAHHGLFCAGPDLDTTFGLMHTVEKAAQIYVLALSCGKGIRQTIPDSGLRAIAKDFGVDLAEEFLEDK